MKALSIKKSRNIVHNEDKGIWVGEFAVPLAHPVNGQSKVADFRELTGGYSDLFKIIVRYEMCTDQTGEYLAVSESKFELRVHTAPGIRFEYSRKNTSAPKAHIHYTGVAGIISPALMRNFADTKDPKKKGTWKKCTCLLVGRDFVLV